MDVSTEAELRHQVLFFLNEFKDLIGQGRYYIKDHLKNREALITLGITGRIRDEIIQSMAVDDYSSGPTADILHPGHYWAFGKCVNSIEIYIKLKIVTQSSGDEKAICLSFHPSEHPLRYPFRK